MPTYEYRCKACGEHLEVVQSFTDDALADCLACGEPGQLRKVFGNIGITFKGSGFYKTDSRSGSSSTSTSTAAKKDSESSASTAASSDSSSSASSSSSSGESSSKSGSSSGDSSSAA